MVCRHDRFTGEIGCRAGTFHGKERYQSLILTGVIRFGSRQNYERAEAVALAGSWPKKSPRDEGKATTLRDGMRVAERLHGLPVGIGLRLPRIRHDSLRAGCTVVFHGERIGRGRVETGLVHGVQLKGRAAARAGARRSPARCATARSRAIRHSDACLPDRVCARRLLQL